MRSDDRKALAGRNSTSGLSVSSSLSSCHSREAAHQLNAPFTARSRGTYLCVGIIRSITNYLDCRMILDDQSTLSGESIG